MGLLNYWYLLFLLFIPIILLLYLLKQKLEDKQISSLLLWRETYENLRASAPWEKLRNNLLMYLQILIAALLALALASPYLKRGGSNYQKAILVIDTSASMNAIYEGNQTRLEKAVAEARNYVDSMGNNGQVTILSMDQRAVIRAANISDKSEASKVLSSLKAADLAGNPGAAMGAVSSMIKQEEDCEAVFFTDIPLDTSDIENARVVDVNSLGVNGCVDYVSSGVKDGKLIVLARVSNPSPYELVTDINLYLDDELADIQEVSLAPDESRIVYFEGISSSGAIIKAEINQKDLLAGDNRAYALLDEPTGFRALLISPGNIFLEKSISLVEGLELYKSAGLVDFDMAPSFDLYIFDGFIPDVLPPSGNIILIDPRREITGIFPPGEAAEQITVTAVNTPVTTHLEDYSLGVANATLVTPPSWGKSFFSAGNASAGYYGEYEGRTIGVICFDLHDSDFALQTEFPIFIHNLVTQCSQRGILQSYRYSTGDSVTLRSGLSGSGLAIINPLQETDVLPVSEGPMTYSRLDYAGVYRVTDDQDLDVAFIVNFPSSSESRVQISDAGDNDQAAARTAVSGGVREIQQDVIICVLILLLIEWAVYLRGPAGGLKSRTDTRFVR